MDRKEGRLSAKNILALAQRESGFHASVEPALAARVVELVDWINERGPFAEHRLPEMQKQLRQLLANRLRIAADRARYSEIADTPIERPVFIIGFARSGTTLLHSLLAEDPEVQVLRSWNVFSPSPPPGAGPVCSGRIAYAQRAIQDWIDFCPAQRPMHPYIDKGAYQLIEDEEVFTLDLRNMYPYHLYRIPIAEINVILAGDQREAFRFHRQFLQHQQWNTGKTRWVCKGPSLQMHLEALFEIYPDALCIWPHRPLGDIYASNVALRAAVFDAITGVPNDWVSQSRAIAEGMKAAYDRLLASAVIDDPRILHIPFREIAADPVQAIRGIYDHIGVSVTDEFATRMQDWLADPENSQDRYGRYDYSYEAFGLEKSWIEGLFADYSKRFGLA